MPRLAYALVFALFATPALADKIDGDWCAADGRHFSIAGPNITTAEGRALTGDYRRHFFAYEIPAPEANAGARVEMALADELTVYLRVGPDGPTQVWKRCNPTS
jgi:hypothetical protein